MICSSSTRLILAVNDIGKTFWRRQECKVFTGLSSSLLDGERVGCGTLAKLIDRQTRNCTRNSVSLKIDFLLSVPERMSGALLLECFY